jgi:hypothetical protein
LIWRAGRIDTVDHPDLDAELALVGFGGVEPPCLTMRRLWLEAVADGGFLGEWIDETGLSPARLSWLSTALERMRSEGYHEFLRHLTRDRAQVMGRFLVSFPRPWLDRAAAEVGRALCEPDATGPTCPEAPALIDEAVAIRMRRAFVDAVGGSIMAVGAAALVPFQVQVQVQQAVPAATGSLTGPGRGVVVTVDRSWLHRVWAPGAAVIDGRLTLAITADDSQRWTAQLLEWVDGPGTGDRAAARRPTLVNVEVERSPRGWSVA